ncbi:MAG TPA: YdcF family protein [Noviherbaspirillum sp.]|nr:YdcF family protein [Noviherbaspirillum sp.]
MSVGIILTKVLSALLLPPLNLILLCAVGLRLHQKRPRLGFALSGFALTALAIISTPAGALLLLSPLEKLSTPLASAKDADAQAIVLLGGGRMMSAPEYGDQDTPNLTALARVRYAAKLYRDTGLPVLASGGSPDGSAESEASIMARSLQDDFAIPVKWIEEHSDDTAQNAAYSATMLKQADVSRILLVTDALHMPRSRAVFEKTGLEVVPAPTMFFSRNRLTLFDFMPSGEGLRRSHYAMHEWIGIAWYSLKS